MTRSQLVTFCLTLTGVFVLLYAAHVGREVTSKASDLEYRIEEVDSRVGDVESKVSDLESEVEDVKSAAEGWAP